MLLSLLLYSSLEPEPHHPQFGRRPHFLFQSRNRGKQFWHFSCNHSTSFLSFLLSFYLLSLLESLFLSDSEKEINFGLTPSASSRSRVFTSWVFVLPSLSTPSARSFFLSCKKSLKGFPVGPVVKNPPCNAGDMGSIPGLGRSHMPQSNCNSCSQAHALQLLRSMCLGPMLPNRRSDLSEKSVHCNWRVAPACHS